MDTSQPQYNQKEDKGKDAHSSSLFMQCKEKYYNKHKS